MSILALFVAGAPASALPLYGSLGGNSASATAAAAAASVSSAQQAQQAAQQSMNSLQRAVAAVQAMQQAQQTARALAAASTSNALRTGLPPVTDGLSRGGLVVDPRVVAGTDPSLWVNAGLPTQTTSNGQTTVNIQQTAQRAVATWAQFNVGKNTTVNFDQSGGNSSNGNNWVILNRIDASGVPSQILGQIKAQGEVLIINPNGIIFGGTSQVNVHTLIASSEDINSNGSTNVSAFSSTGAAYVSVMVNGMAQMGASGNALLAPSTEDNADTQFVSTGLFPPGSGSNTAPSLILSAGALAGQTNAGIVVQQGAQISTDISGFDNGGYVALIGPSVTNAGSILVGSGQIILAAGATTTLSQGSTALTVNPFSTSTNGNPLVYNPPALSSPALVENDGLLVSNDGNITLYGNLVNQNGVAEATTSVNRAGSFIFWANTLTFSTDSVTTILPDENGETIPENSVSSFVGPSITINAVNLDLQGTAEGGAGALIVAPSATMTVATSMGITSGNAAVPTGRVLMESGSVIDLAGLDATTSVSDYLYTFKVTANDVADSPLAQSLIGQTVTIDLALSGTRSDGATWVGSPLFSATGSGYLGDIAEGIDLLLTKGGSLTFQSTGNFQPFSDVLLQSGSVINVSGGSVTYTGATIKTTELIDAYGNIVNIANADPSVSYAGIAGTFTVDHSGWGVSQTYIAPLFKGDYYQQSHTDGISAGSLGITAVNPVIEGTLYGAVQTGAQQAAAAEADTGAGGTQANPDQLPVAGSLSITLTAQSSTADDAILLQSQSADVLGSNFTFSSQLNLSKVAYGGEVSSNGSIVTETAPELIYSTDTLSAAGLGSISFGGASVLSMAKGAVLTVASGGSITLSGVSTIDGTLNAPAGKITITGFNVGATGNIAPYAVPPSQDLTIGPDAVLNVAGLWVNDTGATGDAVEGSAYINGGTVTIQTYLESAGSTTTVTTNSQGTKIWGPFTDVTQSIVLAPGSIIDVSSGGYVGVNGKLKTASDGLPAGNGGSLTLRTYVINSSSGGWESDVDQATYGLPTGNFVPNQGNAPNQANIFLDGTIYASGLNTGGTLTLQAPIIQIGGVDAVTDYTSGAQTGTLALPASFFSSNGFSNYSLTSVYGNGTSGGITVTAGTVISLRQLNYIIDSNTVLPVTGTPLSDFASLGLVPEGLRQPVNLTLKDNAYAYDISGTTTPATNSSGILIATGAAIIGDPGAQITLSSDSSLTVLGDITAPGGAITLANGLTGGGTAPLDIWIGANAVLDVSGVYVPNPLVSTYQTGSVLAGGSITLDGGTLIALPGSQFDLAGTSATIEVPIATETFSGQPLETQEIWSNGGSLTIADPLASSAVVGYATAYFDGTINAAGGAPLASGGTLTITGTDYQANYTNRYSAIVISQSGRVTSALNMSALTTPGAAYPTTAAQLAALLPTISNTVPNYDYISANTINNSGLSSVSLSADRIAFSGNVTLKVPGTLALAGVETLLPAGTTNPIYTAASIGATTVNLDAGYISLTNFVIYNSIGNSTPSVSTPSVSDGTINFNASAQIDITGGDTNNYSTATLAVANAANVNLDSGGDIRLLGDFLYSVVNAASNLSSIEQAPAVFEVPNNLTLTAREVYAATDTAFLLRSTGLGSGKGTINTITIASNGQTPVAPYSVDGTILIDAKNIVQAGALYAPLGTIELGLSSGQSIPSLWAGAGSAVATQSLTLAAGSLTSVSLDGLDLPYGTTVNDTAWTAANTNVTLTAPPSKNIVLNGATLDSQSGATIDLSGGGDIYATEFVPGTGGSRNVLTSAGSGQTVYALVPSYEAPIAPTDLTYGQTVAAGTTVTLSGGNGIAAGTYTLLPAIYATLPGAYRVVVASTNVNPGTANYTAPDGTIIVTGTLGNAITGARSSQTALLEIQSDAVWTKYSEIDLTRANSYFTKLATTNGTTTPSLPIDGGTLTVNATSALTLLGSYDFTPAADGRGGTAAISGTNLLVLAPDQTESTADVSAGYIVLNSDQLSDLGATVLLIGGTYSQESSGVQIDPTAVNVVVETDAAHPLTAPDLLLVATPTGTPTYIAVDDPNNYGTTKKVLVLSKSASINVLPGSVIAAVGDASSAPALTLGQAVAALPSTVQESAIQSSWYSSNPLTTFYTEAYGSGALAGLLQVSNGAAAVVERGAADQPLPTVTTIDDYYNNPNYGSGQQSPPYVIQLPSLAPVASITVAANATISGGTLNINGGNVSFANGSAISGHNVTLAAQTINLGSAPNTAEGLTLTPSIVNQLAGAQSVTLQSASVINLYGTVQFGEARAPIGTLTLDSAGFYSNGGTTNIVATNVDLTDSQATPNTTNAISGSGGTLSVTAIDTLTMDAGTQTLGNFGTINLTSNQQIVFNGTGSFAAGSANVTLTSPDIVAAAGSSQSLTTSGMITIVQGVGTAPALAVTDTGGVVSFSGGSITDAGTITALGGTVSLTATGTDTTTCPTCGDVILNAGAMIDAAGSHIVLFDATEDAPGGTVKLVSNSGNVTIDSGATIDVAATGNGYAGTLSVTTAATGVATLNGRLEGSAAYNDIGGNFNLNAGSLAGSLPFTSGFTGSFLVTLGSGDITVPVNTTLTSGEVLLAANGGSVLVYGTIDASGPSGGTIELYGAGTGTAAAGTADATGVTLGSTAQLLAYYKADDPNDPAYGNGESTLTQNGGTITLGTTGAPDGTYNTTYGYENVDGSGAITVASGAVLDVSGGVGGANISNNGGEIILRAPILTNGNVNVSFKGNVITSANGGPSGTGVVLDAYAVWSTTDGTSGGQHFDGIIDPAGFYNASGTQIIFANGSGLYPNSTYGSPAAGAYLPHVDFYQGTLVNFVQNPFDTTAIAADFNGASGITLGSTLHLRPEIDLVNPSSTINKGNITVASNWNLGAGTYNTATGGYSYAYRTINSLDAGEPGMLTLRAANNVQINATISDGFYETSDPFYVVSLSSLSTLGDGYVAFSNVYGAYAGLSSSLLVTDMPGVAGISAPPVVVSFPSSYDVIDQNVWYSEFYLYYYRAVAALSNDANHPSADYQTTGASGAKFDNNPNDYSSYAAYLAAYNANYAGAKSVAGEPAALTSFDNNPADYASYATYVTAYKSYESAFVTFAKGYYAANPSQTTNLPSPLLAPAPPPAYGSSYETGATNYVLDYQSYTSSAYTAYTSYFNSKVEPGDVTASAGTSNLWLIALPDLPSIAATPDINLTLATSAAPGPANAIANNPAVNVTTNSLGVTVSINDYNTTSSESLMPLGLGGSQGSFSYDFVAGAADVSGTPAADPNAVVTLAATTVTTGTNASDSVTINGHTSYKSANSSETIDIPTLVRTGTGSITIDAAGSFELLDTTAPGVVYTAGAAAPLAADFTAPVVAINADERVGGYRTFTNNGLVSTPAWGEDGGSVTIDVGASIVGIETPTDSTGSQTGIAGATTGEFWTSWYYRAGLSSGEAADPFDANYIDPNDVNGTYNNLPAQQNATWVNYGTFFQGIGALGGGNVTLKAGGNIYDISVSLPETIQVSGGQSVGGPAATAHYYGGGDLVVQAGGSLYSSTFYVGRGTGTIQVGGTVASDPLNPVTGTATTYYDVAYGSLSGSARALPLLLAVQDGFITITAGQSVSVGGMFDPTELPQDLSPLDAAAAPSVTLADIGTTFQSYGPDSGISAISLSGNVSLGTLSDFGYGTGSGSTSLFDPEYGTNNTVPTVSSVVAPAVLDAIALTGNISLASNITQIASPTGTIDFLAGGSIDDVYLYAPYGRYRIYDLTMLDATNPAAASLLGTPTPTVLTEAVHAGDTTSAIIYAGGDITGTFTLIKAAKIEAGGDIINTTVVGQNNNTGDITSIIAGGSILAEQTLFNNGLAPVNNTSAFLLYGPGSLVVEAGHNIGPFFTSVAGVYSEYYKGQSIVSGIQAVGDGSNLGSSYTKSYLPLAGADIYTLFGVGPGIDYAAAVADYVNPASAGTDGIDFLTYIASALGEMPDQAWLTFETLPKVQQQLLVDKAFLNFISQVGLDYSNPASPYYNKYARAYEAIATLFPASDGYTNNAPTNGANGVAATVSIGDLSMAHSLLETQTGGNIYLIGPGGNITVGANAADNSKPSQEGILTLQGGSILSYTDQSVEIYQSRIFTEQGGDVYLFSANGDLNAGKGKKSSASYPPLSLIWDTDGYSRVNPSGLVTGAGIGALLSVPGQDPSLSNANLVAPHGTVDAGAAGIRVAGNLNIVALHVLNAFNITVGGTATGLPTFSGPNIGALTSASDSAGAAVKSIASPAQNKANTQPSILIVEVEGYGGGDGEPSSNDNVAPPQQERRRRSSEGTQDPRSAYQVLGVGDLSDAQTQALIEQHRRLSLQ